MAERARLFNGRKFLWDGVEYESEEEARHSGESYAEKGFDFEVWLEEGKACVYTRRVVKEAPIEQT